MRACAAPAPGRESTWISEDFVRSYKALHARGHAHSVEVWEGDELVGGLYGVTLGGFFGGESMFNRRTDASKAAVMHLVDAAARRRLPPVRRRRCRRRTCSGSAPSTSRAQDYLERLEARARAIDATFG